MAGAAIGVSHLVQATRAGADFGFQLALLVILAHVVKYPFFEYGHRYAAATGESLLEGYARLGQGYLIAFVLMLAASSFITIAGVTFVTAGLVQALIPVGLSMPAWSSILLFACAVWVAAGRYAGLDLAMKLIMAGLLIATFAAFAVAVAHGPVAPPEFTGPRAFELASLGFLIALVGWMPAPIEGSAFQSLWVLADGARGERMNVREARLDFHVGYVLSAVTALAFLGLGALVMHGSGATFSDAAAGFATQLVEMYILTLGGWAGPLVAIAATTTMFSTLLAVLDAYPRALAAGTRLIAGADIAGPVAGGRSVRAAGPLYWSLMAAIALLALLVIQRFTGSLRTLIDVATTLAFLSAPVLGYLNHRLIVSGHTPASARPGAALAMLGRISIALFAGFGLLYLVHRMGALR